MNKKKCWLNVQKWDYQFSGLRAELETTFDVVYMNDCQETDSLNLNFKTCYEEQNQ